MFLTPVQTLIMIFAVAAGTQLTRWLPFLLFPEGKPVPKTVVYLGKVLPPAAMGLLLVYCLRNVSLVAPPHGIPEVLSIVVVVLIHRWRGNALLSILCGTAMYMLLAQLVPLL